MKKADAILCGDIHLREDTPKCRVDNFFEAQCAKLMFISNLQKEHGCPVLCSGDLFHKAIPSLFFVGIIAGLIPDMFYTVYGNHDLPNHNLKNQKDCGVYHLNAIGRIGIVPTHFGQTPEGPSFKVKGRKVLIWHVMTYRGHEPYPGCTHPKARSILNNYPDYDLILTGDNHEPFVQTHKGRLLVNPGSMMRQEAGQIDYKPAVWLWYADTNTVEPVYLPIVKNAVTREHLDSVEEKETRVAAFIEKLDSNGLDFVDFEKNLEVFFGTNRVRSTIKDLTYEIVGTAKGIKK